MTEQQIKTPILPESVSEAVVASVKSNVGSIITENAVLFELETDKVMLEVVAPEGLKLTQILVKEGDSVTSDQVLAHYEAADVTAASEKTITNDQPKQEEQKKDDQVSSVPHQGPAVRSLLNELGRNDLATQPGTGRGGRLTTEDVQRLASDNTERVPMSPLRKTIAKRLVEVQQNSAILTTFNEVNMKPIMDLRSQHKDQFQKKHGVKLGFMSFFVRACSHALKQYPDVNASIDDGDLVYHRHHSIGIAVSAPRGLMVPVLQHCQEMNMAEIELNIKQYAEKARDNKLTLEEMQGGTFSITNGGVFGSMLSTPILNPPQSAILGMHNIVERVIVENGEMVIRPMMYLALSYDHRIIDGSTSVRFLVAVKEYLENPAMLLLDL